jgi:hypothetical protein
VVGAGLGCLVPVVVFEGLDSPRVVIMVGAIAALGGLGALVLAADAGDRWGTAAAGGLLVVLVAGAVTGLGDGRGPTPPDTDTAPLEALVDRPMADSGADPGADPAAAAVLRRDVANLPYWALEDAGLDNAVVVGLGGGREVRSALAFGADRVTGIDLGGDMPGPGGGVGDLGRDPRVHLVDADARSWLTRTDERFDAIHLSLVDTWAAGPGGPGGAPSLAETPLYTTEAWDMLLDRLQPGGILSVTRWYHRDGRPPLEVLRATALAAQVLTDRGIENPRDHILVYEGPADRLGASVATVMVSADPFAADVLDHLRSTAQDLRFATVLTPDQATAEYDVTGLTRPGGPEPALGGFPADLSPPTDDRPFFFQMADVSNLVRGRGLGDGQVVAPVTALLVLAAAIGLLVVPGLGLLVPTGRRASPRGQLPHAVYFAAVGVGSALLAMAQLTRLTTFLGDPGLALAVGLGTGLVLGAAGYRLVTRTAAPGPAADRGRDRDRPRSLLAPLVALLGLTAGLAVATPGIVHALAGATTAARLGVAAGLLAPAALLIGVSLALGTRTAAARDRSSTRWLGGLTGLVAAGTTVGGTAATLFLGIGVTLVLGLGTYALATGCMCLVVARLDETRDTEARLALDLAALVEILAEIHGESQTAAVAPGVRTTAAVHGNGAGGDAGSGRARVAAVVESTNGDGNHRASPELAPAGES